MIKRKTKIYIFHPYSGVGGADLSISRLINGLNPNKYIIDFISINKPLIKSKIKKRINYIGINSSRTFFSFFKIKKYIEDDHSDYQKKIFISNQNFANVLSVLFLKNIKNLKIILLERNHLDELKFSLGPLDLFKKKLILKLIKKVYKKADRVIGNSLSLSKKLSDYTNLKILTIYNPCHFSKIYKRKTKQRNDLLLLNVARLEPQKDQLTLLKAVNLIKNKLKFKLVIIGYGSQLLNLKDFIKKNKLNNLVKIYSTGIDALKFYKKTDLFILTSKYEGFPNVLVEAAEHSIPIISTKCNSGPSEILLNGRGGDLINVGDHQSLATKILFFAKNKALLKKKSIFCKKNLKRFEFKKNIRKFEEVFDKV